MALAQPARSALYESLASSRMHWQPPHQRFGPPLLPPEFPCKDHTPLVSGAIANDVASAAGSRAPTPAAVARAATPLLGRAATPLAPLRRARSDAGLRRARTPDSRPRSQRSQLGSRPGSQPGAPLCGSASVTSMRSIRCAPSPQTRRHSAAVPHGAPPPRLGSRV